jgi:hypothetical protein
MKGHPGSVYGAADAVAGPSGKPIRVYGLTVTSGGGGNGVCLLKNGTTSGGTVYISQTGTTPTSVSWDYGVYGRLFPDGCFVDMDANVDSYVVSCELEA